MSHSIAIVGMACRYPDARSPVELWENVLAQRRAFRRIPSERLRYEDYFAADRDAPDRTYTMEAAVIEGYEFDRVRFRVSGSTFRQVDMAHWLALDVATQALEDAGFPEGNGLPKESTGVLLGNTLTGEFSRAHLMRLRWHYVRRVLDATLREQGWSTEQRHAFLEDLESLYKAPFPPVGEETLAGGLSNTIAGRICNYFDLKGGGYTVDGACAASLLAVANACSSLVAGDLDVALAGGVDLSLDPFEIIGFAKVGALAPEEMRVYDLRSQGFWPGEGCGLVVLMRLEDALAQGRRIYALIRGWGVSSDGSGGITRPEVEGQILALRRCYQRAGFGIDTVAYFEGHGTGTQVGDAVELQTLSNARQERVGEWGSERVGEEEHWGMEGWKDGRMEGGEKPEAPTPKPEAAIGSVKANIGHTKAAAGVAGLIKATMAVYTQVLPPTTGFTIPHPELSTEGNTLRLLERGELWPPDYPLRAGVSAMGFGGINTHIVLEGIATERRKTLSPREWLLLSSYQDAELFLFSAEHINDLQQQVAHLAQIAPKLARSELIDLAAELARRLEEGSVRAAVVASTPAELASRLQILNAWLEEERMGEWENGREGEKPSTVNHQPLTISTHHSGEGVFWGMGETKPRIAFLFPGQGSPVRQNGGLWERRFNSVRALYAKIDLPTGGDGVATEVAQPSVVAASLAGLRVLKSLGLEAEVAIGHSLGELTALHWGGAIDRATLLRLAKARGRAMAEFGSPGGAMASIGASEAEVEGLIEDEWVVIAGLNSPHQTVISGEASAVAELVERARSRGWKAVHLPVSHAFHSPLMATAMPPFALYLGCEEFRPLQRRVASTITGDLLEREADLRELLCQQFTSPVRFMEAIEAARQAVGGFDLLIEVGPGRVLSGLVADWVGAPVVAMDTCSASLKGLLLAVGAAFSLGAPLNHRALFADRFARPFNLDWQPRFFVNPCELAPIPDDETETRAQRDKETIFQGVGKEEGTRVGEWESQGERAKGKGESLKPQAFPPPPSPLPHPKSAIELVRQLVAERAELPLEAVKDDHRLLSDLHLNSITVSQLVVEAARQLNLQPPLAPTDFANATVAEVAQALEGMQRRGGSTPISAEQRMPPGVDAWIRTFTVDWVERPLPSRKVSLPYKGQGRWQVIAPAGHPLAGPLQTELQHLDDGGGVIVCLPPEMLAEVPVVSDFRPSDPDTCPLSPVIRLLLEGARAVLEQGVSRFVLVQHGGGAASFARTLHLEMPEVTTCVVDVPPNHPKAIEWVLNEIKVATGYTEARYDGTGHRYEPVLHLLPHSHPPTPPHSHTSTPSPSDVLLVTGGGKGITAECAFALARETGVRLALMGRSQPEKDTELAANLERMAEAGIQFQYVSVDVTDAEAVQTAVQEIELALGPVTAILHGAGRNVPQLLASLDEVAFVNTVATKVQGLRNVLAAVDPDRLRLLIAFGSIIARTGMKGEADYAVANEWLTRLTKEWQTQHPHCRCLALEWSVWSGVGMGERLDRVDALMRQGIVPIPLDEGISILKQLLNQPLPSVSVVVAGRFGEPPTLKMEKPDLPLLRFLERPRVHFPGVELVVDAEISSATDPYLEDHQLQGERIFPAVMGLEAMAQVAMALVGSSEPLTFEDVKFTRPVVVPEGEGLTIRVAALVQEPGRVEVVIRSAETSFQIDHFRAICRWQEAKGERAKAKGQSPKSEALKPRALIINHQPSIILPERDLYGSILFHKGRFRRLLNYRHLRATECLTEIALESDTRWFSQYLPSTLLLGDPGARDAVIHAVQACIPHLTLLPIGVDRIEWESGGMGEWERNRGGVWEYGSRKDLTFEIENSRRKTKNEKRKTKNEKCQTVFVHARERLREGDLFIYDLEVLGEDGTVLERWEGLHLKRVADTTMGDGWVAPLLGPYLERRIGELIPGSQVAVIVEQDAGSQRRARSNRAMQRALGENRSIRRRPDGKPEVGDKGTRRQGDKEITHQSEIRNWMVSAAHAGDLTLAVAAPDPVGCDLEPVVPRTASIWHDLLGQERFALAGVVAQEVKEDEHTAATRVWAASECLKKAGAMVNAPLTLSSHTADGWVLLKSGELIIATGVVQVRGAENPLVCGVLVRGNDAGL